MKGVDLDALAVSAGRTDSDKAVVSRTWLKQVLAELSDARSAQARAGQAFGLPQGMRL